MALSEAQPGGQGSPSIPSNFSHDLRPIPNTVSATLVANDRLTPQTHWQDVRHLILKISEPIRYAPGDILCVTPRNFDSDVNSLICMMGWENNADTPLCFVPNAKYASGNNESSPEIPFLLKSPGFTLRILLTDYLDIMAIPRRSFFSNIAHYTEDPMHKERLLEFANPEYIDEFYDYTSRPVVFPTLRGRQFSLASGGKLKTLRSLPGDSPTNSGTRFDLLVAIVKYQTVIKKIREGVCTRYLAVLRPGSTLKVQVQKGGLTSSMRQFLEPTVLIGPGTGVAPLRSILWEKAAMATTYREKHGLDVPVPIGPIILLYGGRNRRADFFFEEEWEALKDVLDLTDRIREHARLISRILHDLGGTVYICGSSGKMPQAIREALIDGFQVFGQEKESGERKKYSREEAEKYLTDMEKEGRYKQETW
ncbi:conserved hypothetical protein [Histoplasma mississippiense (nom. inval.)]|uniref:conserved hypothetical protein n=1 Tax=Ajellomyces capsulatus (strain NAm1 / WU24) TaxID=2059318 RepID=UPI000157BE22|nr:conserved hypothetical protein [Histoplasma mississippiense (nom. inval.)]EDN06327.1 conserved hypothetical protein [Histoplasma mississippiense (nom. inval.)]